MSVTSVIHQVTPHEAAKYLDKMVKNRPLSEAVAESYAASMRRGEWRVNGQGLVFDEDDIMIDGQHRCRAIQLYGKPIEILIVRGVKRSVFDTIDDGYKRTIGNVLAIQGFAYSNAVAAVVSWAYKWENDILRSPLSGKRKLTAHQTIAMLRRWSDIPAAVEASQATKSGKLLFGRSHFTFLRWATARARPATAREFWKIADTGEGITTGTPIAKLRDRMIEEAKKRETLSPVIHLGMAIRVWNATVQNKPITFVRQRDDEPVPGIVGFTPAGTQIQ